MLKSTKILTNQRGKYTIILTKWRVEATFFLCGSARGIGGAWCGVQRSTERSDPRKARPPAAFEALLPYRHTAAAAGGRAQKKKNSNFVPIKQ